MSLLKKIREDMKDAMRAKDKPRLGTLRMLLADVKKKQIDSGAGAAAEMPDADLIRVIQGAVKSREDSVTAYRSGGREDLAAKEEAEIAVLKSYLPKPLSPAELEAMAKDAIKETGAATLRDMGKVMKEIQSKAAGRVDGKTASEIVKRLLS
ncbi:MAG: GatB/YqeY domain-containing protein [Acidobacteria bacterium]|nr:GatB/YqeY domain-containing protein [Acidobacteriota bacterium]